MAAAQWLLAFASIFTLTSLALVAISFATDHWLETTVSRDNIPGDKSASFYFTRTRGLFRTCYEGNDTIFLDTAEHVVDGNCITEQGYELKRSEDTIDYGSDYETRIHLMRSHFGFFILAMLFLIIGSLVGIVGCWRLKPFILQIGGLIVFVGAFFAAGGMAFFHGYDYLEREKIDQIGFPKHIEENYQTLSDNSNTRYGYSYILGWVSVGCAAIGAVLFLLASVSISNKMKAEERAERRREKKYKQEMSMYNGGYPNAGYDDPYIGYGTGYPYPNYFPSQAYPTTYPTVSPSYPAITY